MVKKVVVAVSLFFLGACSTLSVNDDFTDAISQVKDKKDYLSIEAKKIIPSDVTEGGSHTLKNESYLTGHFSKTTSNNSNIQSKITVNLTYFRDYSEYKKVTFNGKDIDITPYKISTSSCSEHCSTTQYFSFEIEYSDLINSSKNGLVYTLMKSNNSSTLSFLIPAGYFQAVINEKNYYLQNPEIEKRIVSTTAKLPIVDSKSVEMAKYWFGDATTLEQEQFSEWAFVNRKSISSSLKSESKPLEMLSYWYEKASVEEKASILTWLLNKE